MLLVMERRNTSQIGSTTGTSAYVAGGGDINFATSQAIHIRMKNIIPRGATLNSATLRFQVIAKNAATGQTCYNSVRAHAIGDAPTLIPGIAEGTRPWTTARVEWTLAWPANNTADPAFYYVNVKPILDELMARSDYQPGGYISFMLYTDNENGSDMGIRANNAFSNTPRLEVDVTETYSALRTDINLAVNPNIENISGLANSNETVAGFYQNTFFGAFVDTANQGVVNIDTSFTRLPGVPTLRFTTGTPPTPNDKFTGVGTSILRQLEHSYVFCGWAYIPAGITSPVYAGDPFIAGKLIPERDQWVPFCCDPSPTALGQPVGSFNGQIYIRYPFQASWPIWLSEPTLLRSSFRQMPFNGLTTDILDGGQSKLIDHKRTGPQTAVREWTPRRAVMRNGQALRYPTYKRRADGLLQIAESVKGGPTILQSGSGPLATGAKTYSEL